MNQYLTFQEYQAFGGKLDETPFKQLERKAQNEIDKYTFARLKKLPEQIDEVKFCIFDLISLFQRYEKQEVSSESIDGYSVSYVVADAKEQQKEVGNCIRSYLIDCRLEDGTNYLYCGL